MKIHSAGYGSSRSNVISANNAKRLVAGDYDSPLEPPPVFLRVNTAGVLSMLMANGETVDEDVLAGEVLNITPSQIVAATTTAVVTAYW